MQALILAGLEVSASRQGSARERGADVFEGGNASGYLLVQLHQLCPLLLQYLLQLSGLLLCLCVCVCIITHRIIISLPYTLATYYIPKSNLILNQTCESA